MLPESKVKLLVAVVVIVVGAERAPPKATFPAVAVNPLFAVACRDDKLSPLLTIPLIVAVIALPVRLRVLVLTRGVVPNETPFTLPVRLFPEIGRAS